MLLGEFDQFASFGDGACERLLDQQRDAAFEEFTRDGKVVTGGHDDAGGVHVFGQIGVVREDAGAVALGHGGGLVRVGVHHPDQLHAGRSGEDAGVGLPQVP